MLAFGAWKENRSFFAALVDGSSVTVKVGAPVPAAGAGNTECIGWGSECSGECQTFRSPETTAAIFFLLAMRSDFGPAL